MKVEPIARALGGCMAGTRGAGTADVAEGRPFRQADALRLSVSRGSFLFVDATRGSTSGYATLVDEELSLGDFHPHRPASRQR